MDWREHREVGSAAALKVIVWIARALGRPVARLALPLITIYFLFVARAECRASRQFLARVLGRAPTRRDVYRHVHTFAATILDRFFVLSDQHDLLDVTVHGSEIFDTEYRKGRGLIMLGAHFGSFDVLRAIGSYAEAIPINIVMVPDQGARIHATLAAVAPELAARVIALGQPDTFLRVKERLDAGEVVGILGDRGLATDKTVKLPFLGASTVWPLGPLLLASVVGAPVVMFFPIYRGGRRYDIHLELLADRIVVDRRNREAELGQWVERFAACLEPHVRDAPYNWFNFYDFWKPR